MKQTIPVFVARVVVEDLPRRPAPEIDVEVAQVLGVRADAPFGAAASTSSSGAGSRAFGLPFDPAAAALRLLLVRRIADDDGDRLLPLDLRSPADATRRSGRTRGNPLLLDVGVAQRVGDEHPRRRGRCGLPISSVSSASMRSCATANGPSCISKAISRLDRRRRSPRAPRPRLRRPRPSSAIRRSTPRRNVPVPTAGSATVTSGDASPAWRPKRLRSTSSTSRTIAPTTSGGV